jgi:hypothetical protein
VAERRLEVVRRWLSNFSEIRLQRPFTATEQEKYNELIDEESSLLAAIGTRGNVPATRPDTDVIDLRAVEEWNAEERLNRTREQIRRNEAAFGGVPQDADAVYGPHGRQPRQAESDGVGRLMRSVLAARARGETVTKDCKHCGESREHFIAGSAGLVPKACHCDRSKTAHHVQATLAMDLLELDWAAEGFTFGGELKAENARRKAGNGRNS